MMIREMRRSHPTIQIPQYLAGPHSPPASSDFSPSAFAADYAAALHADSDLPSDSFRMYEFKVRRCVRGRSHDWTECPFAHPGEKALRRDPRRYHYSGTPCPEFRKGNCKRGDSCEFAHGVFECWLHPARYRTQPCKDGSHCKRRVCFFAHSPDQIRLPTPLSDSPPMSPPSLHSLLGSFRSLQMRNVTPCSTWSGSSIPSRIGAPTCFFDTWNLPLEEEEPMERVESGKNLRAAMYAKLRMENSLDRSEQLSTGPDFAWVSELIK